MNKLALLLIIWAYTLAIYAQDGLDSSLLSREWVVDYISPIWLESGIRQYHFDDKVYKYNGKNYYNLVYYNVDKPNQVFNTQEYYRSKDRKTWLLIDTTEILLEDYTLNVGDTMRSGNNYLFKSDFIVLAKDTVYFQDGKPRLQYTYYCSQFGSLNTFSLVEGISGFGYIYGQKYFCSAIDPQFQIDVRCYYENGVQVFRRPEVINCYEKKMLRPEHVWITKENNFWNPSYKYNRFRVSFDQVELNQKFYRKLLYSNDSLGTEWKPTRYLMRELEGKVWMIDKSYPNFEFLKIDMNLELGDSLVAVNNGSPMLITKIDSVTLSDGISRKRITAKCAIGVNSYPYEQWVEGVGSDFNFFSEFPACIVDGLQQTLVCFYEGNQQLIGPPNGESCFVYTTGTHNEASIPIDINPNPVSQYLTISGLDINTKYSIYNISGQVISTGQFSDNQTVDVSFLMPGLYIMKLLNDQFGSATRRFIKE